MCVTVVDSNDPPTVTCPAAGAVTITEVLHMVGFLFAFLYELASELVGQIYVSG